MAGDFCDSTSRKHLASTNGAGSLICPLPPVRRSGRGDDWSAEDIEALIAAWNDGVSSGQLAVRFRRSRSSIVGKVHRLRAQGVALRSPQAQVATPAQRAAASKRRKKAAGQAIADAATPPMTRLQRVMALPVEPLPEAAEEPPPSAVRKKISDLEPKDCRWPVGDPKEPDFYFCGEIAVEGLPYCERHARRAYAIPIPRAREVTRPTVSCASGNEEAKKELVDG